MGDDGADEWYVEEHIAAESVRARGQLVQRLTGSVMGGVHGGGQGLFCDGCSFGFCLWVMDVDESSQYVADGFVNCFNDTVALGIMGCRRFGFDSCAVEELLECMPDELRSVVVDYIECLGVV